MIGGRVSGFRVFRERTSKETAAQAQPTLAKNQALLSTFPQNPMYTPRLREHEHYFFHLIDN
jgi:hypothetical protein